MTAPVIFPEEVVYPESDGEPMGEGDWHRIWMNCVIERLQRCFAGQRVYVAGNMMIYYEEGNPECCVCPDTFVVRNCDPRQRTVYKVWEEGAMPDCVVEISSETTWREDRRSKFQLYARLGIKEYVLYDWSGRWLTPALQAYALADRSYQPVPGDLYSGLALPHLGVTVRLETGALMMFETGSGKQLLSDDELLAEKEARLTQTETRLTETETRLTETVTRLTQTEARLAEAESQAQRAKELEALLAQQQAARKALEEELVRLRGKQPD